MRIILLACLVLLIAAGAVIGGVVKGEDGTVTVQGVPELGWCKGKTCTYIGSLEAALAPTAHPYSYSDLMGYSGLAFRVRWSNQGTKSKWSNSCAVGEMPEEGALLEKLTGWKLNSYLCGKESRDNAELQSIIVKSIDAGVPVLTYPDNLDMAVICGYADGGKNALIKTYYEPHNIRLPVSELDFLQIWPSNYSSAPSRGDCLRQVLKTAVDNFNRRSGNSGLDDKGYWYGYSALAQWSGDVRDYASLDAETQKRLQGLHSWVLDTLIDARRSAVQFLNEWNPDANDSAQVHLQRAASIYGEELTMLEPILGSGDWSEAGRERKVTALDDARRLESAAVSEMEKAVSEMK